MLSASITSSAPALWVTTVACSSGSMLRSTSTVVVPDPRNTVSPGLIMAAAARVMRRFSSACAATFST